jgi:hypothetical protein
VIGQTALHTQMREICVDQVVGGRRHVYPLRFAIVSARA